MDENDIDKVTQGRNPSLPSLEQHKIGADGKQALSGAANDGIAKESRSIPEEEAAIPLDESRITAGVVKLYETMLGEPIPDHMLRLIEQIDKKEQS